MKQNLEEFKSLSPEMEGKQNCRKHRQNLSPRTSWKGSPGISEFYLSNKELKEMLNFRQAEYLALL